MKKLKLPIHKVDCPAQKKKYFITLFHRDRLYFTSKRKAIDFVSKLNVHFSDTIRTMFYVHSRLYSVYLDNYFNLNEWYCVRIQQRLDGFLETITFFHRDFGDGWQSLKMNGYFRIVNHVEESLKYIVSVFKDLANYNISNNLNALLQIVNKCYDDYKNIIESENVDNSHRTNNLKVIHKKANILKG